MLIYNIFLFSSLSISEIAIPIKTTALLTAQQFIKEFVDDNNTVKHKSRDPIIESINKRSGQPTRRLRKSLSWPLLFSEFEQRMEEWEVWDLAVEETAITSAEKGEIKTKEQLSNQEETSSSSSTTSSVDESIKDEGRFERSTRVSVRTSFHDSTQDLSTSSTRNSTPSAALEDSLLEEVKITYVFKEQRTKSSDNLLTQSYDHSLSRPTRTSFRQSLRERLSLNFGSKNNSNNNTNNKNKSTQHNKDTIKKNNNSLYGNSLTVNNNQTNMISRSKSVDCLQSKRDDDDDELCFPFELNTNRDKKARNSCSGGSVGQTKRNFSATRSDLTTVGLHSDDDDECHLNVFTDSDEILNLPSPNPSSNSITQQNSSTPKKSINRSKSYTDIKNKDNSGSNSNNINTSRTKTGEEIFLLSVPNLSSSHNKSKSLDNIHRMEKHGSNSSSTSTSTSKSPRHSPVLRRSAKARTYSDSFRIDSGYFSPDDLIRKDSEASSSTSNLDNVNSNSKPYTITFTPEKSINYTENQPTSSSINKTPTAKSPSIKKGLASILPISVSETMIDETNTNNIIHNAESAHSVEEHGTFNLSVNDKSREHELRLSFTEEEEYVDIDYVIEEEDPTTILDSCEDVGKVEHNNTNQDYEIEDGSSNVAEEDEQQNKDKNNLLTSLGNPEEYRQFVEELHNKDNKKQPYHHQGSLDEVDCPKYRNKTPPLLKINIQSPSIDSETAGLEDDDDETKDGQNEEFTIMHSTYPEINGDGGEPSFESVEDALNGSSTSSPERYRTLSNNECNSPFEDSMKSFEAHEREYASCSNSSIPNGTPNADLTDEEDELAEWENLGDSRRMTFVLLDYLPPIAEEDKASATGANCK